MGKSTPPQLPSSSAHFLLKGRTVKSKNASNIPPAGDTDSSSASDEKKAGSVQKRGSLRERNPQLAQEIRRRMIRCPQGRNQVAALQKSRTKAKSALAASVRKASLRPRKSAGDHQEKGQDEA
ncbi:hypothetical protein PENSPDRAFT_671345 [Peniophora sp. CONT]|nr:hypothetical protein PENSPDRAFT_671345 [Peniophora sp. CONT]